MQQNTPNRNSQLEVRKISKSFKSKPVVKEVSFNIRSGEVVGLLGPNGAGKTTSFYLTVGLLKPDSGDIFLDDSNITHQPIHMRAKQGISYLAQNSSIFRKMSVRDNLLSIMEVFGVPKFQRKEETQRLLDKFKINHIANSFGAALSGGERRRVEIARALIIKPRFLLLDEPFAGIDPVTVQEIQKIIGDLKKDNIGVLITDHNVRETLGICDRSYVLAEGSLICEGNSSAVLESELVRKIYLGEGFSL